MTKIKMCGLRRTEDIRFANQIMPEFVGFVFAENSKRCITPETAALLRWELDYRIASVGVFVDAPVSFVADLARREVIDMVQLHGSENSSYISKLRSLVDVPIIQTFRVSSPYDIECAALSDADFVLLDSGVAQCKSQIEENAAYTGETLTQKRGRVTIEVDQLNDTSWFFTCVARCGKAQATQKGTITLQNGCAEVTGKSTR